MAKGVSITQKTAIGRILIYKRKNYLINDNEISDVESELERLDIAFCKAVEELKALQETKFASDTDTELAEIFKAHVMMLEDEYLRTEVRKMIIDQKKSAERAVDTVFDEQAKIFNQMDDTYMKERAADIYDIKQTVMDILWGNEMFMQEKEEILSGTEGLLPEKEEPVILMTKDLFPSELVKLNIPMLAGIVLKEGSMNSHMAILAKGMDFPTIIQCKDIDVDWEGKKAVIDGKNSCIYVDPTEQFIQDFI